MEKLEIDLIKMVESMDDNRCYTIFEDNGKNYVGGISVPMPGKIWKAIIKDLHEIKKTKNK